MNKLLICNMLLIVALLLTGSTLRSQEIWSFEDTTQLTSSQGSYRLYYHGPKLTLELGKGIIGTGWRTNGYSTWLTGDLRLPQSFAISGWFALESFPTDTATYFALKDSVRSYSIGLSVDRFGSLMVKEIKQNIAVYHPTDIKIERFKWMNLALAFNENKQLSVWRDGKLVETTKIVVPQAVALRQFILGRDTEKRSHRMQDLTTINGLVDELTIWPQAKPSDRLLSEIKKNKSEIPVLAIPKNRFTADFSRPKYHLLPAANWTNETHGLIYYRNRYHIFNQKNASNLMLRQINWGHFSSPDLTNWTEHKPALTPDKDYDKNGIWSGYVVSNDQGVPMIIYTAGGDTNGMAIAFPKDDNLIHWEKYEGNPVIRGQPKGFARTDLRDPYIWKDNGLWYLMIGFGIEDGTNDRGAVLLYSSTDLKKWTFKHTLFEGNPKVDGTGVFWEMPIFKKIGDKYVLLVNKVPNKGLPARAMYWVGDFRDERFIPDDLMPQNLEVVNRLLSPSITEDANGQLTAIAIIPDEVGEADAYRRGWTHLYSIPRVWQLKDGKIVQQPHPNLRVLRDKQLHIPKTVVKDGEPALIVKGEQQIEFSTSISLNNAKRFGFQLYKNVDGSEFTKIYYDVEQEEIVVDQKHATLRKHIPLSTRKEHYKFDLSKPIEFHFFIDGSVLECFINGQDAFTSRIFPEKVTSNEIELFAEGGNMKAETIVWILKEAPVHTDF